MSTSVTTGHASDWVSTYMLRLEIEYIVCWVLRNVMLGIVVDVQVGWPFEAEDDGERYS